MKMSSVSFGGGCSAAMWTSQASKASESSKVQELFGKLDTSGDGAVDATELGAFVDALSSKTGTTAVDADSLFTSLDSDGDGSVSSTEFGDKVQSLFDQLRGQMMGSQLSRPPPPEEGGAGLMLDALLKQYGSGDAASASVSTLAVAA
jgi:hypothetical protein